MRTGFGRSYASLVLAELVDQIGEAFYFNKCVAVWGNGRKEVLMRAVDDNSPKYAAVVRVLLVWKQLPESDVARMLHDYFLVTDDFREMEEQGLVTLSFSGDEYIVSLTTLGRLWLEQFTSQEPHG